MRRLIDWFKRKQDIILFYLAGLSVWVLLTVFIESYKQDLKITNLKEENIKFINELLIIKNYFDINGNLKKILLNKLKKLNAIFNKKYIR